MLRPRTLKQRGREPQRQVSEVRRAPDDPQPPHGAGTELRQNEMTPRGSDELFTDKELTDLALAADPDAGVAADAVPIDEVLASEDARNADDLLPSWYMPATAGGTVRGWRRRVVLLIIISFVVAAAYGICNAYGIFGL